MGKHTMSKKTLVIMAAGLGSRYGGVKQVERMGPGGEILMEYAIYDALHSGFDHIVLIIKPAMLQDVKELFGDRVEAATGLKIDYVFQDPARFTEDYTIPPERVKPFGTVHAVLCAKDVIDSPFAVMNADDYYGRTALEEISAELSRLEDAAHATMVGYQLQNTVSPYGTVTRGVCIVKDGLLQKVNETYKIKVCDDGTIRDTSEREDGPILAPETPVSMNLWGWHPAILDVMEDYFRAFLRSLAPDNIKGECLLPIMMDDLTRKGEIETTVLSTPDHWFGITYQEDKPGVMASLRALHESGVYPETLWGA